MADDSSFASGIDLQVWADDGSGFALSGEIEVVPTADEFDGATIDIGGFGGVIDARIALELQ